MPTISSSKVPSPKSWDEFEEITLSAAKLRWNSTDFYRHGRQGQKQDGVDIWGYDGKRHIGVQCKNTTGELGLAVVETEIANAETGSSLHCHDGPKRCETSKISKGNLPET